MNCCAHEGLVIGDGFGTVALRNQECNMSKPDPQAFARSVLWHLAGLRADVYETKLLVVEALAHVSSGEAKKIQKKWKKQRDKMEKNLYQQALQAAQLEADPPTDPTSGGTARG